MICKKCGAELFENANFCLKCGEAVEHSVETAEQIEDTNLPANDIKTEKNNMELTFHKGTQLGKVTYRKIDTRVVIAEDGLQIEKITKKILRKEKVENRYIPFQHLVSTRVRTVLDYWDTLYGITFAAIGFMFNWGFLLMSLVCFWCGYGKKVEFTLLSGDIYSFPYQFGKQESTILVKTCTNIIDKQSKTTDTRTIGSVNAPTYNISGEKHVAQNSTSKIVGKIVKVAVAAIFAIAFIVVIVWLNRPSGDDYITDVKSHKPFAESLNLNYTYEEVLEKYISDAVWDFQEMGIGGNITIHGVASGLDRNIALTITVNTTSVATTINPTLVELGDERVSDEEEIASFLLALFQAYDEGYEDFSDILDHIFSESEQQETNGETAQNDYLGEYTDIPETLFLGNWNSDISKLEITSRGEKGKYSVTLTVYPWPAKYATWTYEAEYNVKTGNLDCRNGIRMDHGKAAADKIIVYDGDGAAEILVSDGESLSFVFTSACPEDNGVLPSPLIFRTDGSTATPEPPTSLGLSQYYGFYNSKDVGLFWVTLDKGSDDDSFYVYIEYESMLKKGDVHADIKPDGESYMTFSADGMTGSDGIVRDMGSIEGAVSLEILDDGTLHMILYPSKNPDDIPFDVILEPGTRS